MKIWRAIQLLSLLTMTSCFTEEVKPPEFKEGKAGTLKELPVGAPEKFKTSDGRAGWRIKIPGGRALATPAIADGMIFVGGGFGSHEFYVLNSQTGEKVWTFQTGDDGPTAAVVAEGVVAYNTESCTLYVHDAKTGKVLWERWLGDPLMSQPAISNGRLFMAYPSAADQSHHLVAFELKTGKVLWDHKIAAEIISAPVVNNESVFAATTDGTLYEFETAAGKLLWSKQCNATSAPRIANGKVYFSQRIVKKIEVVAGEGANAKKTESEATYEGFNIASCGKGELAYNEPQAAVQAAYLLSANQCRMQWGYNAMVNASGQLDARKSAGDAATIAAKLPAQTSKEIVDQLETFSKTQVSQKLTDGVNDADKALMLAKQLEKVATAAQPETQEQIKKAAGELRATAEKTKQAAETATHMEKQLPALEKETQVAQNDDASVGFAGNAPAAAKAQVAQNNIGKGNVKSIWEYQGSRPAIYKSRVFSVNGGSFRAVEGDNMAGAWEHKIESKVEASRPATPPALAGGKFYVGTTDGKILCVEPNDGKVVWESSVGGNISFEPAVSGGRVYVVTNDGTLICLETGDAGADGWSMWGGSAEHNGGK